MITEQQLVDFFIAIIQSEPAVLDQLKVSPANLSFTGHWDFTLIELHRCICSFYLLPNLHYTLFRRTLFNSPINQRLSEFGAQITIIQAADNLEKQRYRLARHIEN